VKSAGKWIAQNWLRIIGAKTIGRCSAPTRALRLGNLPGMGRIVELAVGGAEARDFCL
jgi:hypothetical protein